MRSVAGEIWKHSLPWLMLIAIAALVLTWRLQLSFDLSLFLPRSNDFAHEILLKQMASGPGSRFVLIGIEGDDSAGLAIASDRLKDSLAADPAFLQVQNGLPPDEEASIPRVIADHRFILADLDYGEDALRQALEARLQDLAFGGGPQLIELIAEDPFLAMLDILQQLTPVEYIGDRWFSADGQAVLMAETRSAATDISAQTQAIEKIKSAFALLGPAGSLQLELTGFGAFGVELQRTIRSEATWRSISATLMIMLVLAVAYRRTRLVLLAAIPLGVGALFGLTVVALAFKEVHGITLAFGFTLLGIAIDYPLHLFSHARLAPPASALERIWPTVRVGALSTLMAYAAIMLAGSKGLAQLGLFTAGGLVAAIAVTRYWLPHLLAQANPHPPAGPGASERAQLLILPAAIVLLGSLAAASAVSSGDLWEDSLSSLSPVPADRLFQDTQLRSALGAADMQYQLVLHDRDLETLLQKNEQLEGQLGEATSAGALEGWQSVSALLPSSELQRLRQDRIPGQVELERRLDAATKDLPFHEHAFDPFLAAAQKARTAETLTPADYRDTPFATWLDAHLFQVDDSWVSLTFLINPDPAELGKRVESWEPRPVLADISQSSDGLLRKFRNGTIRAVSIAAVLMVGLLLLDRHRPRRILWLALTVAAALAVTIASVTLMHEKLTMIHLIGLLLVFGLGLDYALFFSRDESVAERRCTRHALLACSASTVLAFGILGSSSIPLLKNLGVTVAIGSATSFLLAWAGRGQATRDVSRAAA